MRKDWALAAVLLLSACGHSGKRALVEPARAPVVVAHAATVATADPGGEASAPAAMDPNAIHCRPDREHRDEDYTPGGLYAPHIRDSAPDVAIDTRDIPEPEPRAEPRSRFGNRTPYAVLGKHYRVMDSAEGYVERGIASWYGRKFHGRTTSSREPYDMCSFSAAHRTLPLPTIALVTNLDNGRSVRVRVNDRGPFHAGRLIDLSYAAAVRLGVDRAGTARVEVRALTSPEDVPASTPPAAGVAASPGSAVAPTAQAGRERYVQVGSYGDRDNARREVDRLRDAGLREAGLDRAEVDGRTVWRVRIGPLREPDEAERTLRRVHGLGYRGARVFGQ